MDAAPAPRDALTRASEGDPAAVDELLAHYLPDVEAFIARRASARVRERESVSDLAQSVCRELLERLADGRFRFQGEARFRQWLYRAALLKVLNRHRYWGVAPRAGQGELAPEPHAPVAAGAAGTPSEHAMAGEELERLAAGFAHLPDRYREVIALAHVDRLTHAEIAERLGITAGNSRVLLARALAALARLGVDLR